MARGKKTISLGNGVNTIAGQSNESFQNDINEVLNTTPEEPNTMVEANTQQTNEEIDQQVNAQLTAAGITPPNGDNGEEAEEIDEDLQVNVKSSVADKQKAYETRARRLGRKNAGAAATTLELGEMILEGTCEGTLTITEYPGAGPNGKTLVKDDAKKLYSMFRMPDGAKSEQVDTDSRSFRSKLSNYQNMIYLGQNHKKDAQKWFGKVRDAYTDAPADVRKDFQDLVGIFEFASVAVREQLARDSAHSGGSAPLLDDDEILEAFKKPETKRSNDPLIDLVIEAYKKLNLARDGKAANKKTGLGGFTGVGKDDQEFTDIVQSLHDWVSNLTDPTRKQTFLSKTGKRGGGKRRVIDRKKLMAAANANGNGEDTEAETDEATEAQEQGNNE